MSVSSLLLLQPVIFPLQIISLKIKVHQIRVILELPFSIFKLVLHCIIYQVTYLSCEKDSQGICSTKTDSCFHTCAPAKGTTKNWTDQIQDSASTWKVHLNFFSVCQNRHLVFFFFFFLNSAKDNNVKIKQCLRHVFINKWLAKD